MNQLLHKNSDMFGPLASVFGSKGGVFSVRDEIYLKFYKCIAKYVRHPDVACGGTTSTADDMIFIDLIN